MAEHRSFQPTFTQLGDRRIDTHSNFFRLGNAVGKNIVGGVALRYVAQLNFDRGLQIADVGCSNGMDTFSVAAGLLIKGVPAHTTGYDINTVRIEQARNGGPYQTYLSLITRRLGSWGLPDRTIDLFSAPKPDLVRLTPELRQRADFEEHDIREQPLPEGQSDIVSSTNLLMYYLDRPEEMAAILRNMVVGLRPGGLLAIDLDSLDSALCGAHGLVAEPSLAEQENAFFYRRPVAA